MRVVSLLPIVFTFVSVLCASYGGVSAQEIVLAASPDYIAVRSVIFLEWAGIPDPVETDYIALFSPPSNSVNATAWITQQINQTDTWSSGFGVFNYTLLNMRQDYQFSYFRIVGNYSVIIAQSNIIQVEANRPMQGHLSLTGDPTEMRVMWNTNNTETPVVLYGLTSGKYTYSATGNTTTYTIDDLCWNSTGGWIVKGYYWPPGFIHDVVLTELKPNTRYYYRFGYGQTFSKEFSFMSAKDVAGKDGLKIIAYGDSGVGECEDMIGWCEPPADATFERVKKEVEKDNYDMVFHVGDLSYSVGILLRWDQFFYQIEPIATRVPYIVSIGNHEYDYHGQPFSPNWGDYSSDSEGECGVPYNKRFMMPKNGNQSNWFSIDLPLVHFTVFSTEHNFTYGSPQYQWLEADLAKVDHSKQWLVVSGHRPMYSSVFYTATEFTMNNHVREELEALFVKYGVDIGFWGHMHCYERICPVENGLCKGTPEKPGAPMHFVIGMAGRGLMTEWADPAPEWSMSKLSDFGYTKIHIPDRKSFHLQFVLNSNGTIYDDVWIRQSNWNQNLNL